jgi:anti-sigma factor RsiW
MKAMQCDRAAEFIGAYLDQELDADTRRDVAAHLGTCPACAALADDVRRMSRQVSALGREPASETLAAKVQELLAETTGAKIRSPGARIVAGWLAMRWVRQAAAILLLCGLTAAATAWLTSRVAGNVALDREVAAAHVRSLLQESTVQIASSDAHTVKPWFSGRLDYAPTVKDLAAEGYPLAGARLDYVAERRVAALVYHRRRHVVTVFLWPSADTTDAPRETTQRGYNIIAWTRAGIAYWAVSDLNMSELRELQAHL